jgi:hypothetical protein
MENQQTPIANEVKEETSIFSEEDFSVDIYNKHIRQARNAIFATAIMLLISFIISMAVSTNYEFMWLDYALYGFFILAFVGLGFWTKHKPYYAIIAALILYGLFIGINAIADPKTIFSGIIFKIIIISLLVKGLSDAKQAQEMKQLKN